MTYRVKHTCGLGELHSRVTVIEMEGSDLGELKFTFEVKGLGTEQAMCTLEFGTYCAIGAALGLPALDEDLDGVENGPSSGMPAPPFKLVDYFGKASVWYNETTLAWCLKDVIENQ